MKDYFICSAKYLELDIPYPHEEMLKEARALSNRFVPHRDKISQGWESLTLHGLGEDKTGSWEDYGYQHGGDAGRDMFWTNAAQECPVTMNFLLNNFPSKQYGRIRFMKLKPGGYIGLHSDSSYPLIENINLVLNNPKDCVWKWNDESIVDMKPGVAYGMNVHYSHSVINNSNEDRYHMIIVRHDATNEWKSIINKAALSAGVTGKYQQSDYLP
jgi:hypothetical protein